MNLNLMDEIFTREDNLTDGTVILDINFTISLL